MSPDQAPVEASPAAAIVIVEQQPIPAPSLKRVAADADRGPQLASGGKLPPERVGIMIVLAPVKLNRVQVEQGRNVGDRRNRRVPKHAHGQNSGTPGEAGQRSGLFRGHMPRGSGNEYKARKCGSGTRGDILAPVQAA
jgi:hypothetical protein